MKLDLKRLARVVARNGVAFSLIACSAQNDADGQRRTDASVEQMDSDNRGQLGSTGLFYRTAASGESVVLVHGFTMDSRMWAPQVAALSESYLVVEYDQRGHGASAPIEGPYDRAADFVAVLDALGIDAAHCVGVSLGGEICLEVALAAPHRLLSLGLVAASRPLELSDPYTRRLVGYVDTGSDDLAAGLRDFLEDPLFAPARRDADLATLLDEIIVTGHSAQGPGSGFLSGLSATLPAEPSLERLGDIGLPTAVFIGDLDLPLLQEVSASLVGELPNVEEHRFADVGHLISMEDPERFNRALLGFLREHGGGGQR